MTDRMTSEQLHAVIDGAFREGQRLGKQMGMDAAREAVAALHSDRTPIRAGFRRAIAAINALREETK